MQALQNMPPGRLMRSVLSTGQEPGEEELKMIVPVDQVPAPYLMKSIW